MSDLHQGPSQTIRCRRARMIVTLEPVEANGSEHEIEFELDGSIELTMGGLVRERMISSLRMWDPLPLSEAVRIELVAHRRPDADHNTFLLTMVKA